MSILRPIAAYFRPIRSQMDPERDPLLQERRPLYAKQIFPVPIPGVQRQTVIIYHSHMPHIK